MIQTQVFFDDNDDLMTSVIKLTTALLEKYFSEDNLTLHYTEVMFSGLMYWAAILTATKQTDTAHRCASDQMLNEITNCKHITEHVVYSVEPTDISAVNIPGYKIYAANYQQSSYQSCHEFQLK